VSQTPARIVEEALEHLGLIRSHLAYVPTHPQVALDAVCLRLSAAIDRVGSLPPEMRDAVCDGRWADARAMRNRIAHGYATVDPVLVLKAIERDLEPLENRLVQMAEGAGR